MESYKSTKSQKLQSVKEKSGNCKKMLNFGQKLKHNIKLYSHNLQIC